MGLENKYEKIVPVDDGFRDLPPEQAFTWNKGILETGSKGLYVVTFYSIRNPEAGQEKIDRLMQADHEAFEEAKKMPGFYHYFADIVSQEGKSLSFCVWDSVEDAKKGAGVPKHAEALRYVKEEGANVYRDYKVKGRVVFRINDEIIFTS